MYCWRRTYRLPVFIDRVIIKSSKKKRKKCPYPLVRKPEGKEAVFKISESFIIPRWEFSK